MEISIHAPPRGATFQRCSVGDEWKISIHAPPRGATRCNQLRKRKNRAISIHAPPRGATFAPPRFSIRARFQFTPLREGRLSRHLAFRFGQDFNSRPSARGDISRHLAFRFGQDFNSRPSARGDTNIFCNPGNRELFQFTPLREGRRALTRRTTSPSYFNSRPSARGDGRAER